MPETSRRMSVPPAWRSHHDAGRPSSSPAICHAHCVRAGSKHAFNRGDPSGTLNSRSVRSSPVRDDPWQGFDDFSTEHNLVDQSTRRESVRSGASFAVNVVRCNGLKFTDKGRILAAAIS
jgi:hypothetical protein